MQEYAGEIKGGKFYFDRRKAFDAWCAGQKDGKRFIFRIVKDSPSRELSQSRAHFERCGIIADECGMTKEQVSDLLMQDAYDTTKNPAFGKYVTAFGKEYFIPESTTTLTKDEFWKLKGAAYNRLKFLNEDKDPESWAAFPERGENGVILRMCYTWEERPEDRVPP